MPITIFISYRREDSAGHAGRLFDRLREHFGRDFVFLDVVGIGAGVDFVETIDQAVGSCDVLLAVIGREWLTCCDKQNRRRLDDPNDFIRTEISSALKRNVRVVPVLVEGAEMPPTDALPEDLQRLTRRQAVELRDSRWDSDVGALIAALEGDAARTGTDLPKLAPPPVRSGPVEPEAERKPGRKALLWGIALVALLVAAGVAAYFWPLEQERSHGGSQVSETPDSGAQVSETPAEPEAAPGTPPQSAQNTVVGQEPAPGSRVEKGARITLTHAVPIEDLPPDKTGQTILSIWYHDDAERTTATELATFLRGHLPEVDPRIRLSRPGKLETGKLFYASRTQARQASAVARQAGDFLSKATGREVRIQMNLDPKVVKGSFILTMPKL